jgi:hypothetical protein
MEASSEAPSSQPLLESDGVWNMRREERCVVPPEYASTVGKLADMGFSITPRLVELVKRHKGNADMVVDEMFV